MTDWTDDYLLSQDYIKAARKIETKHCWHNAIVTLIGLTILQSTLFLVQKFLGLHYGWIVVAIAMFIWSFCAVKPAATRFRDIGFLMQRDEPGIVLGDMAIPQHPDTAAFLKKYTKEREAYLRTNLTFF